MGTLSLFLGKSTTQRFSVTNWTHWSTIQVEGEFNSVIQLNTPYFSLDSRYATFDIVIRFWCVKLELLYYIWIRLGHDVQNRVLILKFVIYLGNTFNWNRFGANKLFLRRKFKFTFSFALADEKKGDIGWSWELLPNNLIELVESPW